MKAREVMNRDVASVAPDSGVIDALRLMLSRHVSGLPVVNSDGTLAGIVTEGDFLRRAELNTDRRHSRWAQFLLGPGRLASEYVGSHGRRIDEVMTRDVVTAGPDAALADVVELMETQGIKRVPVLDAGRLVGIVSRADLLRALLQAVAPAPLLDTSDAAIQRRIAAEIARQPWGPRTTTAVTVDAGVAHMRGVLVDDRERAALRVLVENEPGVTRVVDHLTTIESMTGSVLREPQGAS